MIVSVFIRKCRINCFVSNPLYSAINPNPQTPACELVLLQRAILNRPWVPMG